MKETVAVASSPSSRCGGGDGGGVLRGRYELGRVLGRGAFAKVHRARDLRSGRALAIKVIHKDKILQYGMAEQLMREVSAMKALRHPNVLELYEVMATRSKIYLAMELAGGGDLFSRIVAAAGGRLREDAARHFLRQLVSAVAFCHSRGVCHRDLKPENLLLLDDASACSPPSLPTLKVADFGLSAPLADRLLRTTACGTPAYAAPEVLRRRGYDGRKADAWSCGVILYVLLAGFLPFSDDNIVRMHKKMLRGDFRCPPWLSADARRVLTGLLDPDPNSRMTVARLAETPWLKKSPVPRCLSMSTEKWKRKEEVEEEEPATMNAFHLIALSEGFDLSPLFAGSGGEEGKEETRAAAKKERARGVVSTLERVATASATIAAAAAAAAEVFTVTPFCRDHELLRPAAKFVVMWAESETQVSAA